jgi:excisionase family DNA binding protein
MQRLLTASQAAALLQVSRQTLANWEKSGTIQTYRVGGIVRYLIDVPTAKEQQNDKKH